MYDLAPVLGAEGRSAFEPGSSLLFADAGGVDIDEWLLAVLSDGLRNGEGAVIVSGTRPATGVLDALGDRGPAEPQSICVIESAGDERTRRTLDNGAFVYSVSESDDLTGIGIGLSACFERLQTAGHERSRVGVLSLAPILDAVGDEAAFKFAHVVTSRLGSAGFLGAFGLERPHNPESKRILTEAFDCMVELKTSPDGSQRRVWNRRSEPGDWRPLSTPRSDR